jgi:5-methylcytosine-specific restriction endonuclease McrA
MENVAVLNADFSYIGTISWERSIVLLYQGKAETVKESPTTIYNQDKTYSFVVPMVIRLVEYVKSLFRNAIPYTKRNVFVRDAYTCQYCGKVLAPNEATVDHIIAKVDGGKSSWENCTTACKRCNNIKADKPLNKCGLKLRKQPYRPSAGDFIRLRSKHLVDKIW